MIIRIEDLDRAAFLVLNGAEVVEVEGRYPRLVFHLEVTKEILKQEKNDRRVVYTEYMKKRNWLKFGAGLTNVPVDGGVTDRLYKMSKGFLFKDMVKFK